MTEELNGIDQQIEQLRKKKMELRKQAELEALKPLIDSLYSYIKEESITKENDHDSQVNLGKVLGGIVARYKTEFQMKRQPQAPVGV